MTEDEVRFMLNEQVNLAGSIRAWINGRKLSVQYVSDVLNGRRSPGPTILEMLGLQRSSTIRQYDVRA